MTGFFPSYLFAWVFWLCLSLGCLGLLLLHHVFRAKWGFAVLPVLEAGAKTIAPMGVLLIPVLVWGMPELYPWSHAGLAEPVFEHRAPYLNTPFFIARAAVYFLLWIGLAAYLTGSTRRERRTGDTGLAQVRTNVSAPGLAVFVLTVTFAMTDWVMSAERHWFSTIYGVWFVAGQGLSAVALGALWWRGASRVANAGDPAHEQGHAGDFPVSRDLGNLLLAFTLFWAYISLSQYLIIWSANLPEETTFYLRRSSAGWQGIALALIVGQFLGPFLALLSGKTKRSVAMMGALGGWVLLMRVLDVYWIVVPSVRSGGAVPAAADIIAFVAIGVVWLAVFRMGLHDSGRASAPSASEVYSHA
jgi:hypothetical protein